MLDNWIIEYDTVLCFPASTFMQEPRIFLNTDSLCLKIAFDYFIKWLVKVLRLYFGISWSGSSLELFGQLIFIIVSSIGVVFILLSDWKYFLFKFALHFFNLSSQLRKTLFSTSGEICVKISPIIELILLVNWILRFRPFFFFFFIYRQIKKVRKR